MAAATTVSVTEFHSNNENEVFQELCPDPGLSQLLQSTPDSTIFPPLTIFKLHLSSATYPNIYLENATKEGRK